MPRFLVIILLFTCSLARAAEVRIVGLRTISEQEGLSLIGGSLEFVQKRPASPSRADDAAYLLEGVLKRRGFNDPHVRAEIRSPSLIVLHVEEGSISTLGTVVARGVAPELAEQIAEQFGAVQSGRIMPQVTKRPPFLSSETNARVSNSRALLQSKGYWDATVTLVSARPHPGTGVTDVILDVVAGPLYHLAKPTLISGGIDQHKTDERLAGLIGEVADTKNIQLVRTRVERIFRGTGYQNAQVEMRARHEKGLTHLTIEVIPGQQFTVHSFTATGAKRTKPDRISNRFKGVEGSIYDSDDVNDRIKKLFATGAFSGLRLDEAPRPDGTIDLTLHAKEGKPDGYFLYAGAGSYEGAFLGGGYYHRNIFGNLWNLTSAVEISGIGLLGNLRITDPFFLGTDLRFTALAFLHSREYDGWSMIKGGLGAELDWEVTERYSLEFSFVNSYVTVDKDGIPSEELGPTDYVLSTLGVTQVYDRRNDPVLPTKGFYASLTTDMGLAGGSDSIGFLRADGRISGYYPVTEKSNLAAGLRAGIIIPSGDESDLPIDLRFFTGGSNSVRSYRERHLGPKASNGDPLGGEAFWVANLEYIQTVKGPFRLVAFVDAGTLSTKQTNFGTSDVEVAVGLGARIDLPIGPIRFEYGHSLTQDPGDPSGTFHFAIGTAF
jgi:outer membrane protein insertion porin family